MPLGHGWAGRIFGTNTGNVSAKLEGTDDAITGVVRIADADHGVAVYEIKGTFAEGKLSAVGHPKEVAQGTSLGDLTIVGVIDGKGELHGNWETTLGTGGPFVLYPHDIGDGVTTSTSVEPGPGANEPPQIIQRTQKLPKFTIFRDELQDLIKVMRDIYPQSGEPAIRAPVFGTDINRLASAFWAMTLPMEVEYIHISLSEGVAFAPRTITVSLTQTGCSFSVSGSSEIWVNGVFDKLDRMLAKRRGWWRRFFEQHALNLNGFVLLAAVTLAPDLQVVSRFIFIGATLLFITLFKGLHDRVTKLRIFLREDYSKKAVIDLPRLYTTLLGAGIVAALTTIYAWLSRGGLQALLALITSSATP